MHQNCTSQFTVSHSRKDAWRVFKSYAVLYMLVTDRSALIHTSFLCLYRRLPSELLRTALFYIMLFHSLPRCMATHNPFNATAVCQAADMPLALCDADRKCLPVYIPNKGRSVVWNFNPRDSYCTHRTRTAGVAKLQPNIRKYCKGHKYM